MKTYNVIQFIFITLFSNKEVCISQPLVLISYMFNIGTMFVNKKYYAGLGKY